MNRGEIWWADLDEPEGSGPGYARPVLVIQADSFNQSRIQTVLCLVISGTLRLAQAPGNVLLPAGVSRLPKDSVINVSQIVTLDKRFLRECVGAVPLGLLKQVETGVRLVLSLDSL